MTGSRSSRSKLKLMWPQLSHTIRAIPADRTITTFSCWQVLPKSRGKFILTLSVSWSLFVTL